MQSGVIRPVKSIHHAKEKRNVNTSSNGGDSGRDVDEAAQIRLEGVQVVHNRLELSYSTTTPSLRPLAELSALLSRSDQVSGGNVAAPFNMCREARPTRLVHMRFDVV